MLFVADMGNHAIRRLTQEVDSFTGVAIGLCLHLSLFNAVSMCCTGFNVTTLAGAPARGIFPAFGVAGLVDGIGSNARFSGNVQTCCFILRTVRSGPEDLTLVRTLPTGNS